jgi:large subunit ribosomal protein L22
MQAIANTNFARFAPRKVNQVLELIRNKPVEKAFHILSFCPKGGAELVSKTLKSAVANAGRLKNMAGLGVKQAWVGQGSPLKRMRPGPQGRGMPYKRKTCHVTIIVDDMVFKVRKKKTEAAKAKAQ